MIKNYSVLQELWQLSYDKCNDTEIRARIQGVAAQMDTFVAEMVLRHTDNLSKTLQ